ncbi:MAG: acetate--CoA ligase family protein [Burkholderiales bacterium]|nr:acetate--CoA ligase family protein [Burkholderiales bacterium]
MSIRNLQFLFRPASLAVIGASDRPGSVGATVMRNLLEGGFPGPVWPVNPRRQSVAGRLACPDVASLPATPDAAVVCIPPRAVPEAIAALGRRGTRAAIVLTGGLSRGRSADGRTLSAAMLEAARPYLLRVLGPNCVGLLVPGLKLNASFAHEQALPGSIAFVTQSGALATALLDWARLRGVGFSHFISLGESADVDFGDVLDYLGRDPDTRSILLYIESITAARKFMSAARAAARNKPVIAVKAGRVAEGAKAASSHTGALAGADDVYDAALARAGILRVATTMDLFDAAETLARARPLAGDRLAILTNGGGPGVLATDALIAGGGRLAELSDAAMTQLDRLLPETWSRGNPVDIIGDAPAARYTGALHVLLAEPGADAVLFIHAPTAIVPSREIARACVPLLVRTRRNVFSCWLGGESVREADAIFNAAGAPTYSTPEHAVRGFLQLVRYRRAQDILMQTPASIPAEFRPDGAAATRIIEAALAAGRTSLSEAEAKRLVAAYGIPVVETRIARDAEEAVAIAGEIGFPVAVKIHSPDVSHKSDVGGVSLDLHSPGAVRAAVALIAERCARLRPGARIEGYAVQRMVHEPHARELIAGIASDAVFGPVILFGQGGTAVEVVADKALALPPLNLALARDLVSRTRVARLLAAYRDRPAADGGALDLALVKLAQLAADCEAVAELDVNPLLAGPRGVIALDVRVRLGRPGTAGAGRLAIRPYPRELEEWTSFGGRRVLLRPIRPEDGPQHRALLARIASDDIQSRFFHAKREFADTELARFTQIDYDREMAFIATAAGPGGAEETLGVGRAVTDPDNDNAEFAVLVRSDLKGGGLGRALLGKLIRYCRERGTRRLTGEVLAANARMLKLSAALGFVAESVPGDPGVVRVTLELHPSGTAGGAGP